MPEAADSYLDVVFDGPPGQQAPRFVEVENAAGVSVGAGKWLQRPDGYWVLRMPAPPAPEAEEAVPKASEPTDAQVEALARALWEAEGEHDSWPEDHGPQWEQDERIDRERCRAMARAALASIGVRELAMEAALANLLDYQANALLQALDGGWGDAIRQCRVAVALPSSAAAEAVRGLVKAAKHRQTCGYCGAVGRWNANDEDDKDGPMWLDCDCRKDLDAALAPFGEGEA